MFQTAIRLWVKAFHLHHSLLLLNKPVQPSVSLNSQFYKIILGHGRPSHTADGKWTIRERGLSVLFRWQFNLRESMKKNGSKSFRMHKGNEDSAFDFPRSIYSRLWEHKSTKIWKSVSEWCTSMCVCVCSDTSSQDDVMNQFWMKWGSVIYLQIHTCRWCQFILKCCLPEG